MLTDGRQNSMLSSPFSISACVIALSLAAWGDASAANELLRMVAAPVATVPAGSQIFDEALWQQATPAEQTLTAPSNVTFPKPPEETHVRVVWNKDYLLVRFDCSDQSIVLLPGPEAATQQRDLPYFKADAVEVFLDPVGDSRMYMEFELAPNNGVFDAIYLFPDTPQSGPDLMLLGPFVARNLYTFPEWNLRGLQTAARLWPDGKGWSGFMAFPAKEILKRLGKKTFEAGMKLKVNFVRFDYFAGNRQPLEITNWSRVLGGCAHVSPAGMGTIVLGP
jgi:hypothetical protein